MRFLPDEPTNHEYSLDCQDQPVCPFCFQNQSDAWEYGHESQDIDCESCGETFVMNVDVSVTYDTHKKVEK